MEKDIKFKSKDELEDWLKSRGVDDDDAVEAADKLFEKKFNKTSRLLGVTVEILQGAGIEDALAVELMNKLKTQQQQQQQKQVSDEDDNILGQGVYEKLTGAVCFFADEKNKPIGAALLSREQQSTA